jgi:hypothetical protein
VRIGFDLVEANPWFGDEAACAYMDGFLAGGQGWAEMGYRNPMSFDEESGLVDTPIGRTYNGYANLIYAHARNIELEHERSLRDWDYYASFLEWVAAYVHQNTFRVNASCRRDCSDSGCAIARTVAGTSSRKDYITLYQTFFYDIDAVWRASTITHEIRHAREGSLHTGGNGCDRGSSCDRRWSDAGANTYEVLWLAAFANQSSRNEFITDARRSRAEARLDYMINNAFTDTPTRWTKEVFVGMSLKPRLVVEEMACSEDPIHPQHCLILAN